MHDSAPDKPGPSGMAAGRGEPCVPITERYRRPREAAKYVGLAEITLAKKRVHGGGPPYSKIGSAVVYDVRDLDAWVAAHKRSSTSDGGGDAIVQREGSSDA